MSIHAHKKARKQAELERMMQDITPLNDLIHMGGYTDLDNEDKKEFAEMNHIIKHKAKRINKI